MDITGFALVVMVLGIFSLAVCASVVLLSKIQNYFDNRNFLVKEFYKREKFKGLVVDDCCESFQDFTNIIKGSAFPELGYSRPLAIEYDNLGSYEI